VRGAPKGKREKVSAPEERGFKREHEAANKQQMRYKGERRCSPRTPLGGGVTVELDGGEEKNRQRSADIFPTEEGGAKGRL